MKLCNGEIAYANKETENYTSDVAVAWSSDRWRMAFET
jgi:hypothetical protein